MENGFCRRSFSCGKMSDRGIITEKEKSYEEGCTVAEERTSNYIKLCDEWAEKFLQMDKEELENAFEKLNGVRLPQGDVVYQIDAFACEPMRFYFWDYDDEFEAQANILFDYSATDFNHVESAVSTAEMGVRRLAEVAGLPLKGITFEMS